MKKEVAQQLDISVTTVNKYIKQELLSIFQEEYRGINCYFIHGKNLEAFKGTHKIGRKLSEHHFITLRKTLCYFSFS